MKRVLIALILALTAVTGYAVFSSARHDSESKCGLNGQFKTVKRSSADLKQAFLWLNQQFSANATLEDQIGTLEVVVCNAKNPLAVRQSALDVLYEVTAINLVLRTPKRSSQHWENLYTDSKGTVALVAAAEESGRQCAIVRFPSRFLLLEGELKASATEKFCFSFERGGWVNDGVILYEGIFIPDENYRPLNKS